METRKVLTFSLIILFLFINISTAFAYPSVFDIHDGGGILDLIILIFLAISFGFLYFPVYFIIVFFYFIKQYKQKENYFKFCFNKTYAYTREFIVPALSVIFIGGILNFLLLIFIRKIINLFCFFSFELKSILIVDAILVFIFTVILSIIFIKKADK